MRNKLSYALCDSATRSLRSLATCDMRKKLNAPRKRGRSPSDPHYAPLHKFQNKKAQFFIASAIVIIFVITSVFFMLSRVQQVNNPVLLQKDMSFFLNNIKEEYGRVVEISLSKVSRDLSLDPNTFLDSNLSSFNQYIQIQAMQRGALINISSARMSASNSSMNASVNITLSTQGSIVSTGFYAVRAINVTSLNGSLTTLPYCTFNVSAKKEYYEPISRIGNSSYFTFSINGTTCTVTTFPEKSVGKYNFTCPTSSCVSSNVFVELTDNRNIYGNSRIPNTGLGYGCAGTCGQSLD